MQAGGLVAVDPAGQVVAMNRIMRTLYTGAAQQTPLVRTPIADLLLMHPHTTLQSACAQPSVAAQLIANQTQMPVFCKVTPPMKPPMKPAASQLQRTPAVAAPVCPEFRSAHGDLLAQMSLGDPGLDTTVALARRLATRSAPIILLGETGTGKEKFARAIHHVSGRKGRFVAINCGAIPEPLVESELFGYADGAFTGARAKGRQGMVLDASGGTLFLDEIGDMPLQLQTRLLRMLAQGEVTPLGSDRVTPVDLRVLCATHRDLDALVAAG